MAQIPLNSLSSLRVQGWCRDARGDHQWLRHQCYLVGAISSPSCRHPLLPHRELLAHLSSAPSLEKVVLPACDNRNKMLHINGIFTLRWTRAREPILKPDFSIEDNSSISAVENHHIFQAWLILIVYNKMKRGWKPHAWQIPVPRHHTANFLLWQIFHANWIPRHWVPLSKKRINKWGD